MDAPPSRLVAIGGANNRLWLQIVSDVTGMPQVLPERTIGAAYGDAFLAGLATGIGPDLDTLSSTWVRASGIIEPHAEAHLTYDAYFRIYSNLYEHARDDLHALARLGADSAST